MKPIPTASRRGFVVTNLASAAALAGTSVFAHAADRSPAMEISIRTDNTVTTLINVFSVPPADQDKLLQLLKEGTETLFSKQTGYVSSSFHKSQDGQRIVNYGQWRSPRDIEAFRTRPEIGEYFKRVKALASFDAIVCEASYVHHG